MFPFTAFISRQVWYLNHIKTHGQTSTDVLLLGNTHVQRWSQGCQIWDLCWRRGGELQTSPSVLQPNCAARNQCKLDTNTRSRGRVLSFWCFFLGDKNTILLFNLFLFFLYINILLFVNQLFSQSYTDAIQLLHKFFRLSANSLTLILVFQLIPYLWNCHTPEQNSLKTSGILFSGDNNVLRRQESSSSF